MINVNPKITTLVLWEAKLSEMGNGLLREHASYIAGLQFNCTENEKDSNPKTQTRRSCGSSSRSQSNSRFNKRQGDFDCVKPKDKKSETVKCTRCGHNTGVSHTWDSCYKKFTHLLTLISHTPVASEYKG